jgi:hypothetical protein
MRCSLFKLTDISGPHATFYSICFAGRNYTVFDEFVTQHENSHLSELTEILARLQTMAQHTGARTEHFKPNQGKNGDDCCHLHDLPNKKLRLYCIRKGNAIVILGGGGPKPKHIRKWQHSKQLRSHMSNLMVVASQLNDRLDSGAVYYSSDDLELEGNLEFNI